MLLEVIFLPHRRASYRTSTIGTTACLDAQSKLPQITSSKDVAHSPTTTRISYPRVSGPHYHKELFSFLERYQLAHLICLPIQGGMPPELIRSETHLLSMTPDVQASVRRTNAAYRTAVRAVANIILTHWPEISSANRQVRYERSLVHPTAKQPIA